MSKNIGGGRPLRVCDLCGGVDDHPRHVLTDPAQGFEKPSDAVVDQVLAEAPAAERSRLVRELLDTSASDRHMDCCRVAGCPTGDCGTQTAGAEELRGGALLAHLMEGAGR
ncbi:hypothetical protein AB0M02_00400 [Actinoplanes sp. NPDC051861]|uniref:hypothetical protein n=1 Tax=Actinoplanes sp. NPDC051861 TaxID=3155170 RepID=UPI00343965E7